MDTPPIAEKVKFWEEQDRINQELIPRVIKLHEVMTNHVQGHESAAGFIASLEIQLVDLEKRNANARLWAYSLSGVALLFAVAALLVGLNS
jgi:hypothetical protein